MKKYLFIVPSAIMTGNGNSEERFLQTLHTIDSIKSRISNIDIWLCDSSTIELEPYMKNLLDVNFLDFSKDDKIHKIKKDVKRFKNFLNDESRPIYELGVLKNLTESYVINQVLGQIDPLEYSRIFKISGRYFLTNDFKLDDHLQDGKMILKYRKESKLSKWTNSSHYRHCITWDFCTSIFKEIQNSFQQIEDYIKHQAESGGLGDIEHGLSLFIPDELVHEIKKSGVVGRVNGEKIHAD